MITFKYKEESLGFRKGKIKRPVADVFLKSRSGRWIEFHPYIDSGADITIIPLSLGKLVGLRLDEQKVEQIRGVRGSIPVIFTRLQIKIGSERFPIRIAWSLIEDVPPLLGRTGVFDKFDITFRQSHGLIEFQSR